MNNIVYFLSVHYYRPYSPENLPVGIGVAVNMQ